MKLYLKIDNLEILKNMYNLIVANNTKAKLLLDENSNEEYMINQECISTLEKNRKKLFYEEKPLKQLIKGVYFGNGSCEHLLSSQIEILKAKAFCKQNHLNFIYVFPSMGEKKIQQAKEILELLNEEKSEVVVNDYGMLNLCEEFENIKAILGLNFTKIIKNAFADNIKPNMDDKVLANQKDLLSHIEFEIQSVREFYKSLGLSRISVENKNINLDFLNQKPYMQVDFYYPNITISNSRACDIAGLYNDKAQYFVQDKCKKYCKEISLEFEHSKVLKLFQKYNSIYKSELSLDIDKKIYSSKKNRLIWEVF